MDSSVSLLFLSILPQQVFFHLWNKRKSSRFSNLVTKAFVAIYRLIFLAPYSSKMLEYIGYKHTVEFIESHNAHVSSNMVFCMDLVWCRS